MREVGYVPLERRAVQGADHAVGVRLEEPVEPSGASTFGIGQVVSLVQDHQIRIEFLKYVLVVRVADGLVTQQVGPTAKLPVLRELIEFYGSLAPRGSTGLGVVVVDMAAW
jgi:hypothetical protein